MFLNRSIVAAVGCGLTLALAALASARAEEAFPSKPIRIVLPYAPGGPTDAIARALGRNLESQLKVPVLVENKPGGQGVIAMQTVMASRPDGYTVGWAPGNALTTNRILMKDLPYKVQDFKLLTTLYRGGIVIVVPKNSPARSLKQLLDQARKDGKPMIYGTAGPGGTSHLTMEQIASMEGLPTQMVSYKGDAPMALDVMAGTLPAAMATVSTTGEAHKQGKLKILAITSDKRTEQFPDIPTVAESGYPQVESYFWAGAVVPAGTPTPVADVLRKAIVAAMHSPDVKAAFTPDITPFTGTAQDFNEFLSEDYNKWTSLIKSRGISLQ